MGQKTNSLIFRLGLKNSEWKYKYIEKNSEESTVFLSNNFEIQNYLDKIFSYYGLILQNCKIEQTQHSVNIFIFFYEQKTKTNKLYLNNLKKYKESNSDQKLLYPTNIKQLILFLTNNVLKISLKLYIKNKTINIKTQNLTTNFERKIDENNIITYKKTIYHFKRFLKDPFLKNFVKILFIVISEKQSAKLLAESLAYYFQKSKKRHNYLFFFIKTTLTRLVTSKFSKVLGVKIVIVGRLNGAPRAKKKILKVGVVPLQSFNSTIDYYNSVSYTQNGTFGIKVWVCEKINYMFLQPKRSKYKKVRKGTLPNLEFKSNKLQFGTIGLKAAESGTISARQIEAARQSISRKINRKGKLWLRIFPDLPITAKPTEVRMGKGKGSVSFWATKIGGGGVIFELCGVTKNTAIAAFKTGGAKLPIKTIIFT